MKQLLSELTLVLLSCLVLLLTINKESAGKRASARNEIRYQQTVEKESTSSLAKVGEVSTDGDQSLMLFPLNGGILEGKSMHIRIY